MQSGRLKKKITIQRSLLTPNAYGERVASWIDYKTDISCAVNPVTAREYFMGSERVADITTRFNIRYIAGITESMRISYADKFYDIISVINIGEANRELEILARQR